MAAVSLGALSSFAPTTTPSSFLLDQRLSTIPQNHWVSKLFGYVFLVYYRQGHLNVVADALSWRDDDSPLLDSLAAEPAH